MTDEQRAAWQHREVMDQFHVGQELRVWSERVLGVPVAFTVTKIGTKYLHGTFYYGMTTWTGWIKPDRVVSWEVS